MDKQILWKNALNNVPGIQTSNGEPGVVKALQKLWKKLHLLEQECHPDKEVCSKETQTSSKGVIGENSVIDSQYKLLKLQLQYLRNTLMKVDDTETNNGEQSEKYNIKPTTLYSEDNRSNAPCTLDYCHNHLESWSVDIPVKIAAVSQPDDKSKNSESSHLSEVPLKIYPRHNFSNSSSTKENHKYTQTSPVDKPATNAHILQSAGKYENTENNFVIDLPLELQAKHQKNTIKTKSAQLHSQKMQREFSSGCQQLAYGSRKSNKQTHYHLKLTDVPFIIGASASASHSLIANVQNIIAMMKTHNKGLCSSATHLERKYGTSTDPQKIGGHKKFSRANSNPDVSAHQEDIRNILNNFVEELADLTVEHETLKQKMKDTQDSRHKSDIQKERYNISKHMESKAKQIASLHKVLIKERNEEPIHRRYRSLSESSTNKCHKQKERHFLNEINRNEQKCKIQPSHNVLYHESVSSRRKLMLELKQLQLHLQQEDICWN